MGRRLGGSLLLVFALTQCGGGAVLRGRIRGLHAVVADAEQKGAMRCAPRELALAKSHLGFAEIELDQGEMSEAETHVQIAEVNAKATVLHTPVERCGDGAGDKDDDGVRDQDDRCPEIPETVNGVDDADGCPDDPDTDGDKIADARDVCPLLAEDVDGYLDEDGCPDPDNDADGVADERDACKNQPEDPDGFRDDDGCPDPDNDGDGVLDAEDACPVTPGIPSGDKPGCPRKNTNVVVTTREIRILSQVQFEFARAVIRPGISFKILDEVRDVLRENPKITLEVQGHTDNVGSEAQNLQLSKARAEAVRNYLVRAGVEASRLTAKGYASRMPIVPNTSEANRALNRRVQFIRTESVAKEAP